METKLLRSKMSSVDTLIAGIENLEKQIIVEYWDLTSPRRMNRRKQKSLLNSNVRKIQ